MLLAALVSLFAALGQLFTALAGSGLGTIGFTMVLGLGRCETIGFTVVLGLGSCETTGFTMVWRTQDGSDPRTWPGSGTGFGRHGGGL